MKPTTICFIICYNDILYLEECCLYLNTLILPENVEIDIITIKDAPSMAEGYQKGMEASDAQYKVYLHQDVFILNQNFIKDILDIFTETDIGMIGMVGTITLPLDGCMWHSSEMRCGTIRCNYITEESINSFPVSITGKYKDVQAVDGLLMATSVDIPWRSDLFKGWDFYDVSQSMEFRKAGYRIVVPRQKTPWCLHDEDFNDFSSYEHWRKIFLDNYSTFLNQSL